MKRVVIASNNPGKLRELGALLAPLGIEALAQSRARRRRGRGAARDLPRERARQGAPCGRATGLAGARRRFGPVRRRARRRARRALGALRRPRGRARGARRAQQREARRAPARDDGPLRVLLLRAGAAAPRRRSRRRWSPTAPGTARSCSQPRGAGGFGYDPCFLAAAGPHRRRARRPTRRTASATAGRRSPRSRARLAAERDAREPEPSRRSALADFTRAPRRASAALALRAHPVVPAEVPVLRLQLAREARRAARGRVRRRAGRRPRGEPARRCGAGALHTIFIGGGTPSLFSRPARSTGCSPRCARACRSIPDAEITLEANPGTFEAERFRGYRAAGVNAPVDRRAELRRREARGDRARARRPTRRAARSTPRSRSFDTRQRRPHVRAARADARAGAAPTSSAAVATGAPHVSAYHLTLEPDTQFAPPPAALPDDDLAADMQDAIEADARGGGLRALRDLGLRAPGPSRAPQPQLLDVRRLPRHRRRRARQDLVPRPHRARGARAQARGVPARARSRAARCSETRELAAARAAVRVHAERAAPHRGIPGRALRASARACRSPSVERAARDRGGAGLIERDHARIAPHAQGPAIPERPARAFPAGAGHRRARRSRSVFLRRVRPVLHERRLAPARAPRA